MRMWIYQRGVEARYYRSVKIGSNKKSNKFQIKMYGISMPLQNQDTWIWLFEPELFLDEIPGKKPYY